MPQKQTGYLEIECLCSLAFTGCREVFRGCDGALGTKAEATRNCFFLFYFLNACGTESCKSLVSFFIFLHALVQSEDAPESLWALHLLHFFSLWILLCLVILVSLPLSTAGVFCVPGMVPSPCTKWH